MMKKTLKLLSILAVVGAMAIACVEMPGQAGHDEWSQAGHDEWGQVRNDETTAVIPGSTGDPVTLTTSIELGAPESKALTAAGIKTFAEGDQIAVVYKNTSGQTVKAVSNTLIGIGTDISTDGKKATITVTLDSPAADGAVRFIYPASMAKATVAADATMDDVGTVDFTNLNEQDGKLTTLANNLDLAVYDGSLTAAATLPASVTLTNLLCIGEFTIKEGSADITNKVLRLTINDGTNHYVVNRLAKAGPVYVAMKPISSDKTVTVSATDGIDGYSKAVTGKTLSANSIYPINVTVTKMDDRSTPLTFEAKTAGVRVIFHTNSVFRRKVKYSKNGGAWTETSSSDLNTSITLENIGDKVSFVGDNDKYGQYKSSGYQWSYFTCSDGQCAIYGNVMSLLSSTAYATATTISTDYTFFRLFSGDNILSHDTKPLLLPATTLHTFCYDSMFKECGGLTQAPALPAMTLGEYCYQSMFEGCTHLETAPVLPATELKNRCYKAMFKGCSSLKACPSLPAMTMKTECYQFMFQDCSSLLFAPDLPATTVASNCYEQMFLGCSSLKKAPESLPALSLAGAGSCYHYMFGKCSSLTKAPILCATTLSTSCYSSMFSKCTRLTEAPVLPAKVLTNECYYYMFSGCENLHSVTCLATDITASKCTEGWLGGVASTGTFYFANSTVSWTTGDSGIPSGWSSQSWSGQY